jgi:hypothetical protein
MNKIRVACIWFTTPFSNADEMTNFAEACLQFSPQIGLRGQQAIFIEIGKSNTLFSEVMFMKRVQVLLKKFNLKASGAVRSNVVDALLAAVYATDLLCAIPLEALTLVIDPFAVQQKADTAPKVHKMIESLQQLGLRTLQNFFDLPAHELPSRFGSAGMLCRHHLERPNLTWPKWTAREVIEESLDLAYDEYCSSLEPLLFKAKTLLDRLFARLRGRGLRLNRMHARFELEKFSTVKKPVHEWDFDLMMPQGSTLGVVPILQERWDRDLQRTPLETSVLRIQFTVTETTVGYEGQRNFFHEREDQTEKMNSVIAHLADSLGRERVFRVKMLEERIPELSWAKKENAQESLLPREIDLNDEIPMRPTRLLKKPQKIELNKTQVRFRNRFFTIESWSEAERISTHWLDHLQVRKYYTLQISEGPSLWVYQDAVSDQGDYYLHGYFE